MVKEAATCSAPSPPPLTQGVGPARGEDVGLHRVHRDAVDQRAPGAHGQLRALVHCGRDIHTVAGARWAGRRAAGMGLTGGHVQGILGAAKRAAKPSMRMVARRRARGTQHSAWTPASSHPAAQGGACGRLWRQRLTKQLQQLLQLARGRLGLAQVKDPNAAVVRACGRGMPVHARCGQHAGQTGCRGMRKELPCLGRVARALRERRTCLNACGRPRRGDATPKAHQPPAHP